MRSRNWIAWGITVGEAALLLAFGIVLGQYWLMLPIWMRSCAALGLILATAVVAWRFLRARSVSRNMQLREKGEALDRRPGSA